MAAGADFDVQAARDHFPALKQPQVFFDNAGGSQTLGDAIESYVPSTSHGISSAHT